jgi:Polyketide cyclase / dehydrase and lipid transport
MLKSIAIVVVVGIAAVLVFAATKRDDFRVQRSIVVKAAPDRILPLIADFHRWAEWSPYEKLDPAMKRVHAGAPQGVGAIYEWEGNSKAGAGRMEIKEVQVPSRVAIQLDFTKPVEGHNIAELSLEPRAGGTEVIWSMRGPSPYLMKLMGVFVNLDRMIGGDFETGLSNLKAVAER